jgi:hypothetical protein
MAATTIVVAILYARRDGPNLAPAYGCSMWRCQARAASRIAADRGFGGRPERFAFYEARTRRRVIEDVIPMA